MNCIPPGAEIPCWKGRSWATKSGENEWPEGADNTVPSCANTNGTELVRLPGILPKGKKILGIEGGGGDAVGEIATCNI